MIYTLVSFLGCVFGYLIGRFTTEELKAGLIYFKLLEIIILLSLAITFSYPSFSLVLFFIGVIIGTLFRAEYFYFGVGVFLGSNLTFLNNALVFLYGLPYGSIAFYRNKMIVLFYSLILFSVPAPLYFLDYNLVSLAGGGLVGIALAKLWKLFH